MAYRLTIAGVAKVPLVQSLRISATANGRDTLACDIYSEAGSYRPAMDDEVVVVEDTGGTSTTSLLIGTGSKAFTTQAGLALVTGERVRAYSAATPTSWMEGKIASYVGATLTVTVDTTSGAGTLADWTIARRIFGGVIMTLVERGLGDVGLVPIVTEVQTTDFNQYADRRVLNITIPAGTLKAALQVLGDYLTRYGVTLDPDQVTGPSLSEVRLFCTTLIVALDTLATLSGRWVWEIDHYKLLRIFDPATKAAPFNIAAGDKNALGDVIVEPTRTAYANSVHVLYDHDLTLVNANDPGEIAAHGLWEILVRAPEVEDATAAADLAAALLAQSLPTPKMVRYETRGKGLFPGQTQTINLPSRNVNNSFLITEVETFDDGDSDGLRRRVTAIEGSIYQPGWRAFYGGAGATGAVVSGGGGSAAGRRVYFLGGSSISWVQSSGPDWIPIDGTASDPGHQVAIDTVALGGTTVTVTVRMRAMSGTVTARLRNVSDSTTAGTSAAVNSTTFQTVTFSATLTAGAKIYRLELLPSLANVDVNAIAYAE